MRKLDKPIVFVNKSHWVHPVHPGYYMIEKGKQGIRLFNDTRMIHFDSFTDIYKAGWKEEMRSTVLSS